jgi:hypothetical protein
MLLMDYQKVCDMKIQYSNSKDKTMATFLYLLVLGILMQTSLLTADSRQHVAADRRKNNPTSFNIGGVLSNRESMMFFKQTISVSSRPFLISMN